MQSSFEALQRIYNQAEETTEGDGCMRSWKIPQECISLYNSGKTLRELSEIFRCAISTVRCHLLANGVPKKNRQWMPSQEDIDSYKSGSASKEIAKKHGLGASTILTGLRTAGVAIRKRGGYKSNKNPHIKEIIDMFLEGFPYSSIAVRFNLSKQRIQQIIKREHITRTWKSLREISKEFDVPYHRIFKLAKKTIKMNGSTYRITDQNKEILLKKAFETRYCPICKEPIPFEVPLRIKICRNSGCRKEHIRNIMKKSWKELHHSKNMEIFQALEKTDPGKIYVRLSKAENITGCSKTQILHLHNRGALKSEEDKSRLSRTRKPVRVYSLAQLQKLAQIKREKTLIGV